MPLRPSIPGYFLQSLSIGSVLIPKLILVSNTLIFAPYVLPATMMAELFLIVFVNWLIFGTTKGRTIYLKIYILTYVLIALLIYFSV